MTRKEIIDGLKMTMGLITFDPSTGEDIDPDDLNDLNRTTYDACKCAVELLESQDVTLHMNLPEVSVEEAVEILKRNNRIELIPSGEDTNVPSNDTISRQAAIDALETIGYDFSDSGLSEIELAEVCEAVGDVRQDMIRMIKRLPPAQPERDIPVKPIETTDKAWGIPKRQAVCPKCDYYLGHVAFLGDYKGKRITYCETCGQAIDWTGWEFDE